MFGKKNKVTKPVEISELEKQGEDIKKMAKDVSLMFKYGVSRLDYSEAYLKALVELHPEIKDHPAILDLLKREEEYQKEKS